MPFKWDVFRRLIPRLAKRPRIRAEIVRRYGHEADAVVEALSAGASRDADADEELQELVWNAFKSEARTVVTLSWEGTAPGGSGAVWVLECTGIYTVTSSDYSPLGPFESLGDALSCECFFVPTREPQLDSDVLPEEELLEIGRGVVDWENGGSVWVNGVEFVAERDNLCQRHALENDG